MASDDGTSSLLPGLEKRQPNVRWRSVNNNQAPSFRGVITPPHYHTSGGVNFVPDENCGHLESFSGGGEIALCRHATQEMMCMQCLKVQPVGQTCSSPECSGFTMARYFCSICKFFDDDERAIYHCPFCNLCRVGKGLGSDYFHCMTCNACMSISLTTHKCREKGMESNCPICHDFLFTSNTPVKALPCGHFMHSACFQAYARSHYTCPICCKSYGDMSVYFGMLDALLAAEELPDEYKGKSQDILCNDCEQKAEVPFHFVYHKCTNCGSYNTRTI